MSVTHSQLQDPCLGLACHVRPCLPAGPFWAICTSGLAGPSALRALLASFSVQFRSHLLTSVLWRLIALTAELERECPCQLSQHPFKDFSEACSHKMTATKGQSCWLPTAAAKSCFACVNHRSASLSSRCAQLCCCVAGGPFTIK